MLQLSLLLLILGIVVLFLSGRKRTASGLPKGRIIYTDTGSWGPVEKPLYDPALGLTGKPDYLVDQEGDLIPVEVKSTRASAAAYDTHIFQLAAYCLLVESAYGKRPPFGILKYANRSFAIDYTPELENSLLDLIEEMREQERRRTVSRSHDQPQRCTPCGYRSVCDQRL